MKTLSLFLLAGSLAPLTAQTTHVVSGGGSALANAIAAAAPGDILVVQAATYTPVTVTQALRIELQPGAVVSGLFSPTAAITVSGLPAGSAVVVTGGRMQGVSALQCAGVVVVDRVQFDFQQGGTCTITNCTGPVAFQDITQAGSLPYHGGSLDITASDQVSFTRCALPRATVTGGHVTFAEPDIFPYGGTWPPGNSPSLRIAAGTVSVRGGRIAGGAAASLPYQEFGIQLLQGDLTITGGARVSGTIDFGGPTAAAIDAQGGVVHLDPSTILVGTVPIQGPGTVLTAPVPALNSSRTPGSGAVQFTLNAVPGAAAFTLLDLAQPVLPTPWGDVWLNPAAYVAAITPVSAGGTASFSVALAGVPPYLLLVAQSATFDPSGAIAVSPPQRFVWD